MPLINDIVTYRKYVPLNYSASSVGSLPDIDGAERKYLIPILTEPIYNVLEAQVTGNAVTWTKLLNLCRAAVANLAESEHLPFRQAQLSDTGLHTIENTNQKKAFQWEYNKIDDKLIDKGMLALEQLLEHLIAKAADYTYTPLGGGAAVPWSNAEATGSFIKTGSEFSRRYVNLVQPNLTFQLIKPVMQDVEEQTIKAAIGEDFFAELRDNTNPTINEHIAIQLIKKTVAHKTAVKCAEQMIVKVTPGGLLASLKPNSDERSPTPAAGDSALSVYINSHQRDGDNYFQKLMDHLNEKASSQVFATFFGSIYYTAPAAAPVERNDTRGGLCVFN